MAEGRRLNVVLWILQGLLALLYLVAGGSKLWMTVEQMTADVPLPGLLLRFIGVAEIVGAFGLVLPGFFGIRPGLTPLAALGLLCIMTGATLITFVAMGPAMAVGPFTVGVLVAFVFYGRWRLRPLPARIR
jgi:uncharacterized membrane protein YphA (DoxX/SURF4 family)